MTSPSRQSNPLLEWALTYAVKYGFPVFPIWWIRESGRCACGGSKCSSPGKHPLGDLVPNGLKQASVDPEVIRFWWEKFPNARIGIATGRDLGVIDVDPKHSGDETMQEVERVFGKLPATPMALTPSGGWHLFFRKRGFLKSKVGALGQGVDTRGDGGYVVAAPSPGYAWDAGLDLEDTPIADLPEWVYRIVNLGTKSPDERPPSTSAPSPDGFISGGRNDGLTQLAGAMRRKGMSGEEILGALLVTNRRRCQPPLDEAEVKKIAYGMERYEPSDPVKTGDDEPADPDASRFLDPIERVRRLGVRGMRLPTGFATLDKATRGGPLSGRTLVIGGAPGAGKTTLAVQLVRGYAMLGHPVLVVAADEEADGLVIRWGQNENIEREALERGDDAAKDALVERFSMCGAMMIVDQDEDDATFDEAVADFTKQVAALDFPPDQRRSPVIVVDSLQTVRCKAHLEIKTVRERLDATVRAMKRAAKQLDALLIATSELARGSYRSRDANERIDDLAAFKESGGIEYGVTTAIVLRSVQGEGNLVDVTMPKNRLGPMLGFRVSLDRKAARFAEVATTEAPAPGSVGRTLPPEERLRSVEKLILAELREHIELSANGIHERVQARRQTILVAIEQLTARGVVMCTGRGPKAKFTLATAPGREAEVDV